MKVSRNELRQLTYKAALGLRLPVGLAEEAAETVLVLMELGLPGGRYAAKLLRAIERNESGGSAAAVTGSHAGFAGGDRPLSTVLTAPLACLWITGRPGRVATLKRADSLAWTIAVAARFAAMAGHAIGIFLSSEEAPVAVCRPSEIRIRPGTPLDDGDLSAALRCLPADAPSSLSSGAPDADAIPGRAVEIDDADWACLATFGDMTLVPSSEYSRRHGAGYV